LPQNYNFYFGLANRTETGADVRENGAVTHKKCLEEGAVCFVRGNAVLAHECYREGTAVRGERCSSARDEIFRRIKKVMSVEVLVQMKIFC